MAPYTEEQHKRQRYSALRKLQSEVAACDISVIIVNWNTREITRNCLDSLVFHSQARNYEIILVDNGSVDGSVEMVESEFPQVRIIKNERNLGFATACNQGLRQASGRYFLLLNSDTQLTDDALDGLQERLEKHPSVGIVGPALEYLDGKLQPSAGWFPTLRRALLANLALPRFLARLTSGKTEFVRPFLAFEEHRKEQIVDWVAGACMLVRKAAVADAGLLDETIFLFAEEWDWCFRLKQAGWKVLYTPAVHLIHLGSASWTLSRGRLTQAKRSGIHYFLSKHRGNFHAACFKVCVGLAAIPKIACWSFLLIFPKYRPGSRKRLEWATGTLRWTLSPDTKQRISPNEIQPRRIANADSRLSSF